MVKEPSLAPILPNESQDKSIDEERRRQALQQIKPAPPIPQTQQEQLPESRIEEIKQDNLPKPELVKLQPKKRTKRLPVPPEDIRRSERIQELLEPPEQVGPVTRSKKSRAHSFITTQVDKELSVATKGSK